jgi:ssDNA-binding Zn-finger/Zn-ribbon topoisomerase 1
MGTSIRRNVYYCPKCDKTIPKDRVEKTDMELRERFGIEKLSHLRCPVCDTEYIDLDRVVKGGEKNVGKVTK